MTDSKSDETEKTSSSGKEELPSVKSSRHTIISMRRERLHQRREVVGNKLDALELKAWTNPGPHLKGEMNLLVKQLEELDEENDLLIADLEALITANEEEISSNLEEMRTIWGREYDLQKHVTTLSTASILGLGALTNLFPSEASLSSAAAPSLISFLVAIVLAVFGMSGSNMEILIVGARKEIESKGRLPRFMVWATRKILGLFRLGSLIAFCYGVLQIVAFVMEHA